MTRVDPGKSRVTVSEEAGALRFVIPAGRHWFMTLFLPFWLLGWAWGEVTVLSKLIEGGTGAPTVFLWSWLGAWTVGGLWTIYTLAWNAVGRELVVVDGSTFVLRREILGVGRSKEFDCAQVRGLRASRETVSYGSEGGWVRTRNLAFDYGARTCRFGEGLDEAEAQQLVEMVKQRYPVLTATK